ncbi:DUF551 domain-containing protein, partial [Escherichia coli]|uniref:DUF551 domain-containing protein n=1 Tax=Escherichia coli TaxID=562 RepID=UPI00207B5179
VMCLIVFFFKGYGTHRQLPPAYRRQGQMCIRDRSCSERMPEKYDFDIWVFSPSRGVLDGLQWDGSMFTDDEYQFVIHDATHWMRKVYPAAPQQDGE